MDFVTITPKASQQVKYLISELPSDIGLRLAVKGGGCSGFTYDWQPMKKLETEEADIILNLDSGHLILDGMSVLYLAGMQVDYKKDLFGQRLMVENPNVKSMCGCGESFNVELH